MKVLMQATAIFEWEEDSENWIEENPKTEEELVEVVKSYIQENGPEYFLDVGMKSFTVGKVKP